MYQLSRRGFVKKSLNQILPACLAPLVANQTLKPLYGQPSPKRIRVGQIGTTHAHADGKMEAVRKLNQHFEVVGVVEEDADQRSRAQRRVAYQDLRWLTAEQLLNEPGLQLVLVETDIDALLTTAGKSLAAGCHVHLDKPAGASLEHFRRITDLAASKQRLIQMGYMFRSNPAFEFLFDAVQQGWLGEIFQIDAVMSKKVAASERAELAKYRGGAMFELGCHLIDAVVKLLGKPTKIRAFNQRTHPELDSLYDNCLAVFEYARATATIRSSVVEVDGARRRQLVVCGTSGTIVIAPLEPATLSLTLDQPRGRFRKGTQTVEMPAIGGRYDGDLTRLATAIRGETTYEYSLEHDLIVQACILEASDMLSSTP
jgi:predicted dehydrogenase